MKAGSKREANAGGSIHTRDGQQDADEARLASVVSSHPAKPPGKTAMANRYAVQAKSQRRGLQQDAFTVAHAAVSGGAIRLPHFDKLQSSFCDFELAPIRAHIDEAATTALGSRAFAYGEHVVFAGLPDLHTAAHEVAHVIQQRAGYRPSSGLGETGDRFERHADSVADAVVRGAPVTALFQGFGISSQVSTRRAGGLVDAAVQRYDDGGVCSHDPDARHTESVPSSMAPLSDEAYDDGASSRRASSEAKAAYSPTWYDVRAAAAGDADTIALLDIAWIDRLPARLVEQIDREFSEGTRRSQLAATIRRVKAQLRGGHRRELRAMTTRLRREGKTPEDIEAAVADRQAEHSAAIDAAIANARSESERKLVRVVAARSRVETPREMSWYEGRVLSRVNFMAWGLDVLGSFAQVKQHFGAIRKVGVPGQVFLWEGSARRLELAARYIAEVYPESQFPASTVSQALRGRHEKEHGRGMMGHPLGFSIDYFAADNPFQKDDDGVTSKMLERFGGTTGDDGEFVPGSSRMDLGRRTRRLRTIQAMGRASQRGCALNTSQEAFLGQIEQEFHKMVDTSERFQASLPPDAIARLGDIREHWRSTVLPAEDELKRAQRAQRRQQNAAKRRLIASGAVTRTDWRAATEEERGRILAADTRYAALQADTDGKAHALSLAAAEVETGLREVFAPWIASLTGDLAAHQRVVDDISGFDALETLGTHAPYAESVGHLTPEVRSAYDGEMNARGWRRLRRSFSRVSSYRLLCQQVKAHEHSGLFAPDVDLSALSDTWQPLRDAVLSYIDAMLERANRRAGFAWIEVLLERLVTPVAVFGRPNSKGRFSPKAQNVPILQYLERGFARNDAVPAPGAAASVRGQFNARFIQVMARHGFDCGGAWNTADTMHFDDVSAYGRMRSDGSYSPQD